MHFNKIPVSYAKALIMAAKETGRLDAVYNDILMIAELIKRAPDLRGFLENPVVENKSKKKFLKEFFASRISNESAEFLSLLINNKRGVYLEEVCGLFKFYYKKEKGIKSVTLKTAIDIDEKLGARFMEMIEKKLNSKAEITKEVDTSLIGGFTLKVDDRLYDASARAQLEKLRSLLSGKT